MENKTLSLAKNSPSLAVERGQKGHIKLLTEDELQSKLEAYFAGVKKQNGAYNAVDMAYSVGLTVQQLREGEGLIPSSLNRELVKRAFLLCESDATQRLIEGKPPIGLIFYLKNVFGWKDKREEERTFNIKVERVRFNKKPSKIKGF